MSWGAAGWLWALPVLLALVWWDFRDSGKRSVQLMFPHISRIQGGRMVQPTQRGRRWAIWFWVGLFWVVVALARPQWGKIDAVVQERSREVLIALDLSRSMLAQDVSPDRLERAKLLTLSLLDSLKGERVGLVVFAGTAFLQCPMSNDTEVMREMLPSLTPSYLPQGGTDYPAMLQAVLDAFPKSSQSDRFLVVLSDGESHSDQWRAVAGQLRQAGVRAVTLGVGTSEGGLIPSDQGFVKDERGAAVLSKLEPSTLQELAKLTNGVYVEASNWVEIGALIDGTIRSAKAGVYSESKAQRQVDRYQWPLVLGLLAWLGSLLLEWPSRPGRRQLREAAASSAGTVGILICLGLFDAGVVWGQSAPAPQAQASEEELRDYVAKVSGEKKLAATQAESLVRKTLAWGEAQIQSGHPPTRSVVMDGIAAADWGQAADPALAPWEELKKALLKLLENKPPQQEPKKQDPPPKNQDDQKSQSGDSSKDKGENSSQDKDGKPEQNKQDGSPSQDKKNSSKQGDGQKKDPQDDGEKKEEGQKPPGQEGDAKPENKEGGPMQSFGGDDGQMKDLRGQSPALADALRKLQEATDKDSPAKLFQLMNGGEKKSAPPKGKDW